MRWQVELMGGAMRGADVGSQARRADTIPLWQVTRKG